MNISGLTGYTLPVEIGESKQAAQPESLGQPTFLDVFKNIFNEAVTTDAQKKEDMLRLMLGDTDDIEMIQLNIQKAERANDLFIAVKNTIFEAYSEIIRMNI